MVDQYGFGPLNRQAVLDIIILDQLRASSEWQLFNYRQYILYPVLYYA
jgi:hypothetical protein